jgi:cobalt/nickel transport system permease protein
VAGQRGFLDAAQKPLFKIIPDYIFPGVSNGALATILAGILGSLIVFGVALAVAYARHSRRQSTSQ